MDFSSPKKIILVHSLEGGWGLVNQEKKDD